MFYKEGSSNEEKSEEYDTIVWAIGRTPETEGIGLDRVGVVLDKESRKIVAHNERTSVPHIYAIGDVLHVSSPFLSPMLGLTGRRVGRSSPPWLSWRAASWPAASTRAPRRS